MTVQELAEQARGCFELRKRQDGRSYVTTRDDSPDWVDDLVRESHRGMLPDDWRYERILSALEHISACDSDPDDLAGEFANGAVDTYTNDRIAWLASNINRAGYCDESAAEFGADTAWGIIGMIGMGQYMEAAEIFASVLDSLEDLAS